MSHRALKSARSFFSCRGRQEKREKKGREGKERHKKSRKRYISPICGEAPCKRIFTKFCTSWDMPNVIICANFSVKKLRGLGYTGGSNFGVSNRNGWSPLQQCCATTQPVRTASLQSMRWRTGSQCSCSSSGWDGECLGACRTAAMFCMRCSFWMLLAGAPCNTALQSVVSRCRMCRMAWAWKLHALATDVAWRSNDRRRSSTTPRTFM